MNLPGKNHKGSILIASLWTLSVFSVFVSGVGFQAAQQAMLLKREQGDFQSRIDFVSALNLLTQKLLEDKDPGADSPLDSWYGEVKLPEPWNERVKLVVGDEESRFDLNKVPQTLLENLYGALLKRGDGLKGDAEDFAEEVIALRTKAEFLSLEELYLSENIERTDVEILRPYLTIHTKAPWINVNTADDFVLEVLIRSLPGDDLAKQELLRVLLEYRKGTTEGGESGVFSAEEMTPEFFMQKLELTGSVQNTQLVQHFLGAVVTDSLSWNLAMTSESGREAFAVIRDLGTGGKFEIAAWRES